MPNETRIQRPGETRRFTLFTQIPAITTDVLVDLGLGFYRLWLFIDTGVLAGTDDIRMFVVGSDGVILDDQPLNTFNSDTGTNLQVIPIATTQGYACIAAATATGLNNGPIAIARYLAVRWTAGTMADASPVLLELIAGPA